MIKVELLKNMRFVGKSITGHSVVMDTSKKSGGEESAPTPMEYILLGLGGCTGMDVISILRKMRQDVTGLSIGIESEKADEHPHIYTKIKLIYFVQGNEVDEKKVRRAIELSQDKYCSVSAMLGKTAELSWELKLNEVMHEE